MALIHIYWQLSNDHDGISAILREMRRACRSSMFFRSTLLVGDLRSNDVVVLHGCYKLKLFFQAMSLYFKGVEFYWCPHGSLQSNSLYKSRFKKLFYHKIISSAILKICSSVIFVSEGEKLRSSWIARGGIVLRNGMSRDEHVYSRTQRNIQLVYIGRVDKEHKGIDRFPDWLEHECSAVEIYGPVEERLKREYPLLNFKGPVYGASKLNLLRRTKIFIMFSRYEGLPMAAIEALRAGCVLVVTPECNLGDVISKYNCGYVVSDGSEARVAIRNLLTDSVLLTLMSDNAKSAFENEFDIGVTISRYMEIID